MSSDSGAHPFQLFKLVESEKLNWQNLSVHASVHDAVKGFLKELFSKDLQEDIGVGQATVNPGEILKSWRVEIGLFRFVAQIIGWNFGLSVM